MIDAKRLHEIWEQESPIFSMTLDNWLLDEVSPNYNPGHTIQIDLPWTLRGFPFNSVLETLRKRGFKCSGWSPTYTIDFDFT